MMRYAGVLAIALTVGLPACQQEPRSYQYFMTHLDQARSIAAACASGSKGGDECESARMAVAEADRSAAIKKMYARQPKTDVTSRSDGKAIPNPRRGSFKKSEGGTWGYTTPNTQAQLAKP
jgi:hypothetical protein